MSKKEKKDKLISEASEELANQDQSVSEPKSAPTGTRKVKVINGTPRFNKINNLKNK